MTLLPKHQRQTDLATVVILTMNEEIHIPRAVENAKLLTSQVFILDSGSTDKTRDLAKAFGAEVFYHAFENYGDQRQWALRELPYKNDWVFFLDADELLSDDLIEEIQEFIAQTPDDVDGYRMRRRFYWMGRWLRHGGLYPLWLLRMVRRQNAWCEDRTVNEHLLVSGLVKDLRHDILHVDLKPISDWIAKHNSYSSLEAREYLRQAQPGARTHSGRLMGSQAERKRWLRTRIVDRLVPPIIRPLFYFSYGYFLRFGFLDGKPGLLYHVLRSFSYRFMIEAKYMAIRGQGSEAVNPLPSGESKDERSY